MYITMETSKQVLIVCVRNTERIIKVIKKSSKIKRSIINKTIKKYYLNPINYIVNICLYIYKEEVDKP